MEYLVAALIGVISSLLAAEFYAHAKKHSCRLIEKAVLRIPKHKQDRYREEWLAHLEDIPGNLGRLAHAFECYFVAARGVAKAVSKPRKKRIGIVERPRRKIGLLTIGISHTKIRLVGMLSGRNLLGIVSAILKQIKSIEARSDELVDPPIKSFFWAAIGTATMAFSVLLILVYEIWSLFHKLPLN